MATHKKSLQAQQREQYKRHNIPMSGIRHLFTGSDGLMHNQKADAIIQQGISKSQSKSGRFNLRYGCCQETSTRVQWYKDAEGNKQRRVITTRSIVQNTERDLATDKTVAAQLDTGKIVTEAEIQQHGLTWSGFLQQAKKEFRETRG